MGLDTDNVTPLYRQVKQHLENVIITGELGPGDRLPSERDLELEFGVSRITVRRALQELANEDRIQRIPGKGSFVLEPKVEPLTALTSFSENMRAQGRMPTYKHARTIVTGEPPDNVLAALDLGEPQQVLHIHRLMLADGLPLAIQDSYLPYDIYERDPLLFVPEVLNSISLYKILEVELGIQLYRAEEQVDAATAYPDEAEQLQLEEDEVVLIIKRTTYSLAGKPVEYVKLIFPATRYRYKVELFRPPKSELR